MMNEKNVQYGWFVNTWANGQEKKTLYITYVTGNDAKQNKTNGYGENGTKQTGPS